MAKGKKEQKRLEKLKERKEKEKNRAALLQELNKHSAPSNVLGQLERTSQLGMTLTKREREEKLKSNLVTDEIRPQKRQSSTKASTKSTKPDSLLSLDVPSTGWIPLGEFNPDDDSSASDSDSDAGPTKSTQKKTSHSAIVEKELELARQRYQGKLSHNDAVDDDGDIVPKGHVKRRKQHGLKFSKDEDPH
ncbi:hypothetical protein BLNAU_8186 [Blattamonas nauphoetae]|uniref:Uncharacterized protein n=1 Tax=Blattamonas nauphoetae TaxID=2049346 RepID=A0ABQ9XZM2_9EUKA|nr:hypothetical protein BLNAU_8186 [Blattamonas nauphoetae]